MELTDALKSLRRHWKFSVGVMVLAVIGSIAFVYTRKTVRAPDKYRASVDILIPAADSKGLRPPGVPGALLQGQSQLALSRDTEQNALDGAGVPASRRGAVSFTFVETSGSASSTANGQSGCTGTSCSDVVTLGVTADSAKTASDVARAYGAAYISARRNVVQQGAVGGQQQRKAALGLLKNNLDNLTSQIQKADPAAVPLLSNKPVGGPAAAALLPPATPEDVVLLAVQRDALLATIQGTRQSIADDYISSLLPGSFASTLQSHAAIKVTPPPPSSKVPVLAILGIALAVAILVPVLRDRLDRSIRSPKVAADALDATVLTVLPSPTRRLTHSFAPQGSDIEEAFRALAATAVATDRLPRAIVIMSPTGTLQDMVAANFGAALASLGLRVALVATDPRQRWFAHDYVPDRNLSFGDLLKLAHRGQLNGELTRGLVKTDIENLYVLPPGNGNGDMGLDGLRPLLEALATSGIDVSVVAGPSLLEDPDATIFAWTTRSVLWTVEAGETTEAEAKEAAARLDLAGASAFGIVMVSARQS